MDRFTRHATGGICICSFLWNVAHSFDFFEERRRKMREEQKRFERSFSISRIVVPIIMVLVFFTSCVIFWCLYYRRRQRFWAMQAQQRHIPPPLAPAPGPGPVTSGATTFGYSEVNPLLPRAVTPPPPAHYSLQRPYSDFSSAPPAQPFNGTAMPSAPPEPPPPYSSETKPPF